MRPVAELHQKDLARVDEGNGVERQAGGGHMQAVQCQPQAGVVHLAHQGPGGTVVGMVARPSDRLVGHPQAAGMRQLGEQQKVCHAAGPVGAGIGLDVGAQDQHLGPQPGHLVHHLRGDPQNMVAVGHGHPLIVPQSLVGGDLEAAVAHQVHAVVRPARIFEQVPWEQFRGRKARLLHRAQLVGQPPAERGRGTAPPRHQPAFRIHRAIALSMAPSPEKPGITRRRLAGIVS